MNLKKHIPNTLTCCNLLSGCAATYFAFQQDFPLSMLLIVVGAAFDFFDGFAARLLHVSSPIGKELDSLADDITFGFAPAAMVFAMLQQLVSPANMPEGCPLQQLSGIELLPYAAFLIAAFSALRLAKFNLDERQADSFIGLPTPANALFWASLAVSLQNGEWLEGEPWLVFVLLAGILLSCYMLVAEIPMFALKFKSFALRDNVLRYCFLAASIFFLATLREAGFAIVIVFYVFMSVMNNLIGTKIVEEAE